MQRHVKKTRYMDKNITYIKNMNTKSSHLCYNFPEIWS